MAKLYLDDFLQKKIRALTLLHNKHYLNGGTGEDRTHNLPIKSRLL